MFCELARVDLVESCMSFGYVFHLGPQDTVDRLGGCSILLPGHLISGLPESQLADPPKGSFKEAARCLGSLSSIATGSAHKDVCICYFLLTGSGALVSKTRC